VSTETVETLDPVAVGEAISKGYRRYLRSLLPFRDRALAQALNEEIDSSPLLSKGPLLEATPAYATRATPRQLMDEGVLTRGFTAALNLDRPLYVHQEQAIRKARAGRNLVVATGTGSGKTESFLVPILNALEEEHERGELGPGVRALLLYPMNALANDQLKRLRGLLANSPHITFGRYTGETRNSADEAHNSFRSLHQETAVLSNELLSREEMRESPPHLLLTNYAMLEYLLLRPKDLDLFEGAHAGHWRFIALDEAHVYDGAKAAEIAMLLRRLRDRVATGRPLQCIATSATVGDDPHEVMTFAQSLFFDSPFVWDEYDADQQDLVRATPKNTVAIPVWGPLPTAAYADLLTEEDPGSALPTIAARHEGVDPAEPAILLAAERRMWRLRRALTEGPRSMAALAETVFDDDPEPLAPSEQVRVLADLVALGSRVRGGDGSPLLSARYHLFTRATDGMFACLHGNRPHVSLARHEACPKEGCGSPAFELAACQRCGDAYLCGVVRKKGATQHFVPQESVRDTVMWLHLGEDTEVVDEDDVTLAGGATAEVSEGLLCTGCGTLMSRSDSPCPPGCRGRSLRRAQRFRSSEKGTVRCLTCGYRSVGAIRRFRSGGDASAAVIATTLYQALPEDTDPERSDQPGGGRKLLAFSDSRQAAAFFAPFLNSTYQDLQQRRLILQGLLQSDVPPGGLSVLDTMERTVEVAEQARCFRYQDSHSTRLSRAGLWVMSELVSTSERQSLEGQGLIRVEMLRPEHGMVSQALPGLLGLSEEQTWDLLSELVRTMRLQGVVTMPSGVKSNDPVFAPRLGPIHMREDGSETKRKVLSWLPSTGHKKNKAASKVHNRRLDYLTRVLRDSGCDQDPRTVLAKIWELLRDTPQGWLTRHDSKQTGVVYQVDHEYLRISPSAPGNMPYACDSCKKPHPVSVRGVCTTMNCSGRLLPLDESQLKRGTEHYRHLYQNMRPVPLSAQEHTAQWTSSEAASVQQDFIMGKVNTLSCSTTFELGVDVGDLQAVLMRNMPPTTANYVQRAGRAGRRVDSAALVVTHALRRSHDLFRYQHPEQMISGKIPTPFVPLANERIDRRHAHSVALSAFFRHHYRQDESTWNKVGEFFPLVEGAVSRPVDLVAAFLDPVPEEITRALERILPEEVAERLGLPGQSWARVLVDMLRNVRDEVDRDLEWLEERRDAAIENRRSYLAAQIERTSNTIRRKDLLNFLATRNVLPKYGFPVDTVELRTVHADDAGGKLELTRDLTSAIHEYAPGASIVAGGKRWVSAGVYRLPERGLREYHYRRCPSCGYYEQADEVAKELPSGCGACGSEEGRTSVYCVPEFGFVSAHRAESVGRTPPDRFWNGFTEVRRLAENPQQKEWPLINGGKAHCLSGSRGELVAISEGRNGTGFYLCQWCDWGAPIPHNRSLPKSHPRPGNGEECTGPLRPRSLGHRYETDLMSVRFEGPFSLGDTSEAVHQSLLYALLEGASSALEISRDDIGGTVHHDRAGHRSLALFDTVPGGAGGAVRIAESFDQVLKAAYDRVNECDCGPETSCYGCLRTYRNQMVHELLRRGAALEALAVVAPR
jgi:hypothetical protein